MTTIEFFDPSGATSVVHSFAARLGSLDGKRIGFLSNGQWQSFRSFELLRRLIEEDFPSAEVLPAESFPQGTEFISKDSTIEQVRDARVDAVIVGNAACGACSTACGVAAAKLEVAGTPTVTVTREDFVGVVRNAAAGVGLPADIAMVTFPIDLFLPESELDPVTRRRQEIYGGLTHWSPAPSDGPRSNAMLSVEGDDYQDALTRANHMFLVNRWGDGLPLWPATVERVDWILQGSDRHRHDLLGRFPPRGGLATVEAAAIALAMSGGRPEYLPLLLAAVEAMLDPEAGSDKMQATSGATFPVVIVNGPVAGDVRLSSGFGCLGPDPQFPAGAAIGRALRQMQQNLGGAMPGAGTMAPWGAQRMTNAVFAEDEAGLPEAWLTHGSERHGFAPGTNSVSLFWGTSATNILRRGAMKETQEQDILEGLHRIAAYLAVPSVHYTRTYEDSTPGALLLTRVTAGQLAARGWDKQRVRQFLWRQARLSQDVLQSSGLRAWIEISPSESARRDIDLDPWPITSSPEDFVLVVAGGGHPTHSFWLPSFSKVIGRVVTLPKGFQDLLNVASRDLGSAGEMCLI